MKESTQDGLIGFSIMVVLVGITVGMILTIMFFTGSFTPYEEKMFNQHGEITEEYDCNIVGKMVVYEDEYELASVFGCERNNFNY